MKADGLLQIAWLIANAEAKNLGATEILPVHFLLATMKIIDPKFPEQLDALDVSSDDWAKMCKEAQSIRHYIDVLPDRVTKKRRTLRARLAQKQVRPPIKEEGLLHRVKSTKRAFSDAIFFADGDTVTLKQLVQSLFEMELVSVNQVDADHDIGNSLP